MKKTSVIVDEPVNEVSLEGLEFEVTEIEGKDVVFKALNTSRLGIRKTVK